MSNYHISKDNEKGKWRIKKEGAIKVSELADTQKKAEKRAKELSANTAGGEVRIHGLDGKIRDSDTVKPGNDPKSSKDKKH
tara:strand:- start:17407 stop:17649 length:243 start_codon:yes stop_codon:yes gene_type:complete